VSIEVENGKGSSLQCWDLEPCYAGREHIELTYITHRCMARRRFFVARSNVAVIAAIQYPGLTEVSG
jgi:hypothetical protein